MKNKHETENYFECERCNINSLTKDRICPCPRGSCEAEIVGEITTIIEIKRFRKKNLQINKPERSFNVEYRHSTSRC